VSEPKRPEDPRVRDFLAPELVAVLWGELLAVHPTELLGMMSQGRKTGLLFVEREGVERLFGFVNGEMVLAISTAGAEKDDAREAVLGLLRQQTGGTFTFLRGPLAQVPRAFPPLNTQQVVLDSLRKLDESGRLAG
jgi:Domain of unknown function (DUF4388)